MWLYHQPQRKFCFCGHDQFGLSNGLEPMCIALLYSLELETMIHKAFVTEIC